MRARLAIALLVVGACAQAESGDGGGGDGGDGGGDGGADAAVDAAADGCPRAWFADADGDGHGDPAMVAGGCEMPAGYVELADDCDDGQALVHPGAVEVCDGLDNDCSAATSEICNNGCVVRVRPAGNRYLFCAVGAVYATAAARCTAELFRLVRVDDAAEHTYVRSTTAAAIGNVDVWVGASDVAVEGAWRWDDGEQFWAGGSGGGAVNGLYEAWGSGEPNNDDNEDCGELRTSNDWNDVTCSSVQAFVCERY